MVNAEAKPDFRFVILDGMVIYRSLFLEINRNINFIQILIFKIKTDS